SRSCVFVVSASAARPAPMAWEPTSPMKMRAGAAFHHRNPAAAEAMAAATTARSRAGPTWYRPIWRNSQKPMNTKAAKANTDEPDGSDSDDGKQHEGRGGREHGAAPKVGDAIAGDGRSDQGDAAHRRRARLGEVTLGPVLADRLADATRLERPNEDRGEQQGE